MNFFLQTLLFLSLFFTCQVEATTLSERIILSGVHSGKKLIDVVQAYTIPGESSKERIHIPSNAIDDAFDFFDRYAGTVRSYSYLGINPVLSKPGVQYLGGVSSATSSTIGNQRIIIIFDLNLSSSLRRLHAINLETGEVDSYEASHGLESDCGSKKPGFACKFISDVKSDASPLGFFQTGQIYNSEKHGGAITLNGLEKKSVRFSGNDVPSSIVIHSAPYVYSGHAGRSNGCPAVSESNMSWMRNNLKDGALFYFYHTTLDYSGREPAVSGLQPSAPSTLPNLSNESDSVVDSTEVEN